MIMKNKLIALSLCAVASIGSAQPKNDPLVDCD
jgi:hypothetical protein